MKITTINYLLGRRSLTKTLSIANSYSLVSPEPSSGPVGEISQYFDIIPSLSITAIITPSDNGKGGTFFPPSLSWAASSIVQRFQYTPVTKGSIEISTTNNAGLIDPSPVYYLSYKGGGGMVSATGGWLPVSIVSAGSDNAQTIKTAPGVIGTVTCFNINASPRYCKFYNLNRLPVPSTDTPVYVCPMQGNTSGGGSVVQMDGAIFDQGIALAIVSGIASNNDGSVGSADCVVSFGYR